MKRFKLLCLSTLIVTLLAACATDSPQTGNNGESAQIEFSKGLSFSEVNDLVRDNNMNPEYMLFKQKIGDEEIVGGVLVEGKDIDRLENAWPEMHRAFIEDMASDEEEGGYFKTLATSMSNVVSFPEIVGITGSFSKTDISKLREDKKVSALSLESEMLEAPADQSQPGTEEPQLDTQARKSWAPIRGKIHVKPSKYGRNNRYVKARMTWESDRFRRNDGYEHDFKLNNYSESTRPGTYFSTETSGTGAFAFPKVEYWSTNWPFASRPYLDNRFLDSRYGKAPKEVGYTIGMLYADEISSRKDYYTYIRIKKGDANTDNAKLVAVKTEGRYSGGRCFTQWCMFEYDSQSIYRAWNLNIPAGRRWWFNN